MMTEATQQFGKYRILGELGRGGFATVFRAVDTTLEREVALKILHPQLLADSTFVQRFRQEARTLVALRHPQIITVYEVGEGEGRLFIAMDLAHGPSLAQSIARRGRIPWSEALELLKTICTALDYAHGQWIVHRDLKPANVLLDKQRGVLLTDFGFARLMGESSVSLSMSGGVAGTPGYIAPEVWELNAAEAPADIYALGCIAYEMLTGEVLFKGQTPMQVMRAHDRGPAFPEAWQDDVPRGMAAVLSKALAHDPAGRYSSAMALWYALNDLEAAARAAREAQAQTALIGQWRSEAEAALAAGELSAARMAIGRWLALAPDDPAAREARARLERMSTPAPKAETVPPPKAESAPPPRAESAPQPTPVSHVSKQPPPQRAPTADSRAETGARPPRKGLSTLTMAFGGFVAVIILLIGIVALIQGGLGGRAPAAQPAAQPTATAPPTRGVTAAPAAITAPEAPPAPTLTAAPAAIPAPARTTALAPTAAPAAAPAPTPTAAPGAGKGQIVFSSDRDEPRGELYLVNLDGSGLTRLTNSSGGDDSPAWSRDGSRIAFVSDHDGDPKIYVMNADGSGQTNVTNNPAGDSRPAWRPRL
ncbi:MAG TPA: protein kinase [Roseiflexaceae bacterium]|jgi:serine/threonine-protein kinase